MAWQRLIKHSDCPLETRNSMGKTDNCNIKCSNRGTEKVPDRIEAFTEINLGFGKVSPIEEVTCG